MGRSFSTLLGLALIAPGVVPAPAVPAETGAVAVAAVPSKAVRPAPAGSRLEPSGEGLRLEQRRRSVDFSPDGIRVRGRRGGPGWSWRLTGVASSAGAILLSPAPVRPRAEGGERVRYDRGQLTEEYLIRAGGIEQRFVLPSLPPLDGGDLVLTGAIASDGTLRETPTGWSWRDAHGEVTLGRVTVLDAEGRTLASRFEVRADGTRLVVDGAALAGAPYPVVVDPEIGTNDLRISTMGPNGNPSYDAYAPDVAYNHLRDQYLVVWDGDDNSGGLVDDESEIFGQLLDGDGNEILPDDVRISFAGGTGSSAAQAFYPAVAFNSIFEEYLVVWEADHPADGCVDEEVEIWGQLLDETLDPIFGGPFRISFMGGSGDPSFAGVRPDVAYNSNFDQYLVVWSGDHNAGGLVDGEFEIWAQRLTSTGLRLGGNLRMSDMGGTGDEEFDAADAAVAFNSRDNEYLIVWAGDDDTGGLVENEWEIYAQRIDASGVGLGTNDARLSDIGGVGDPSYDAYSPAVAYNRLENQYLVVWLGDDNVGGLVDDEFEVFSQRLTATLGGLGPNDYRLSDAGGIGDFDRVVTAAPRVAFNETIGRYLVVWAGEDSVDGMVNGETEVFAQLLSSTVEGLGPNDERISDMGGLGDSTYDISTPPVVAANTASGQYLVAWSADEDGPLLVDGELEIFVQRMDGLAIFVDGFETGDTTNWDLEVP